MTFFLGQLDSALWTGAIALYNSYLMIFFWGPLEKKCHQNLRHYKETVV
jgi:hypothetical protein